MNLLPFEMLACPLDGERLQREGQALHCVNGHSFDVAKQGYVNLFPVQYRRSRDPGDSKAMVAARSEFLQQGFYQPIAQVVNEHLLNCISAGKSLSCLDAGCGDGYYTGELQHATGAVDVRFLGMDISKWAILAAAKKHMNATWVVASNARIPVQMNSFDCVLCVFGFPVYQEFARVLKAGGRLIQVDAGQDHLRELREIIYPSVKPQKNRSVEMDNGFVLEQQQNLNFQIHLKNKKQIQDLLAMTPHRYRAEKNGLERLSELDEIELTVDAKVSSFRCSEQAG